jgi:hypothetical protein
MAGFCEKAAPVSAMIEPAKAMLSTVRMIFPPSLQLVCFRKVFGSNRR